MREKPVSLERIEKYVTFIGQVRNHSEENNPNNILSLSEIARSNNVSSAAPAALIALRYIDRKGKNVWNFNTTKSLKEVALKVLDHLLHKNKKTIHVPIDGLAEVADSLKTIGERLADIYVQNSKLLKTAKNGLKSNDTEADLFRVDDQELYIAGQIASGVYKAANICLHEFTTVAENYSPDKGTAAASAMKARCRLCGYEPDNTFVTHSAHDYEKANQYVMLATADLMNKLRNKEAEPQWLKPDQLKCSVCDRSLGSGNRAAMSQGKFYCEEHIDHV